MMNSNGNVSVSEPNEKIIQNKHNDYDSKEEKIMPLVTSKEMLLKAQKGGYAVGAFNAENMEMVKAIIQAAEELKAPVMIQTTPSTVKYGTVETYAAIVAAEAAKASVPVCLHLDHGSVTAGLVVVGFLNHEGVAAHHDHVAGAEFHCGFHAVSCCAVDRGTCHG